MARPALVANLRFDTSQFGQPRNPVRTARLSLIDKVVVQFAKSIHLAAVLPGLAEKLGLAGVFLRQPACKSRRNQSPGGALSILGYSVNGCREIQKLLQRRITRFRTVEALMLGIFLNSTALGPVSGSRETHS